MQALPGAPFSTLEAPVTTSPLVRLIRRAITAVIVLSALAAPAAAQRATSVGFAPARQMRRYVPMPDSVTSGPSYAVPAGALAGAILVGAYAHQLGAFDCDGSADSQRQCRRTLLIGGMAVGAGLGAIVGHIIQLGNARDARRAVADSAAAARQRSARPSS